MENFSFYIFGKSGKSNLQSKFDENNSLFHKIAENSQTDSQLTVYRKESLVCYVYVKKLSNKSDYFGIGLCFQGSVLH
ncbi:hypothetical protein FACS189437_11030 [Bacteroidia bacterium]|nr:hypothetical protein FACS189437_11030 [Bacteroidia bacterium]